MRRTSVFLAFPLYFALAASLLGADVPDGVPGTGTLRGTVVLAQQDLAMDKVTVLIVQLGRTTRTDENGIYEFHEVPEGTYEVVARAPALTGDRQTVRVVAGETATADFQMRLATEREKITVTASGREQTTLESFQATSVLDTIQLVENSKTSLGEVLEGQPGVAKRSFGPGTARPVIRGFDGDRVLILKDGMSTGSLSSQSGDHGETVDTLNLERLEVVKGPATLLYGSNAIGGVVNAVSPHSEIHEHPHGGLSGYVTGVGGTANAQGGGAAGFEFGLGPWLLWADGGGQRTGSYDSSAGRVDNSQTRLGNGSGGFGRYAEKNFFNVGFGYENSEYGIPPVEDEVVHLALRRYNTRFTGGFRNLDSFVESFRLTLDYSDYHHEELSEEDMPNTIFDNNIFSYRGVFEQKKRDPLMGSMGFSGWHRDYKTSGEEAIAPPLGANNVAVFTLQEMDFEHFRLQFGGRIDHTSYDLHVPETSLLRNRSFTGFSGAVGINVPLWSGGVAVANYTHSYRSPALEELYNDGPHPGNATFEIGNSDLNRERGDGIDLAFRHQANRIRAEADFFYYRIQDFVFLAPTGNLEDGLIEAEYLQAASRFRGGEASLDVSLRSDLWLRTGLDFVDADLTSSVASISSGLVPPSGTPLPRIPPLRGRIGMEFRRSGLSVRPQAIMAGSQNDIFTTETRTAGYTTFNVSASYTIARQHAVHVFSITGFNLGDRLYRNHLSFIKDIAPEIGRGVRVGYTVRFF